MAAAPKPDRPDVSRFFVSEEKRAELRKIAREVNARAGIPFDPTITAEQELMRAQGVRPENNGASRELLRMRYGGDYEEE
ncbi:MAG TPA: hypothetical protein VFB38_02590 [Chthonomonadaceae bacterium]|nr:hypothetical protein [Chthonomonadaceae bacterium]